MKILKKFENALLEKFSMSYFQIFFFSNCHKVVLYKVFKVEKAKYVLYVHFKSNQKIYFYIKITWVH
jgi:hypothetical protein